LKRVWLSLAVLLLPALVWAGAPVRAAHADLAGLPREARPYYRYFDLTNLPQAERETAVAVMAGHVQGLSTEADITPPAIVPGTAGGLVRVNLLDYGWGVKLWEKLADVDPYYHQTVEVDQPYGYYGPDGKQVVTKVEKVKKRAIAPWVTDGAEEARMAGELIEWTQSQAPILRADWFFNQTAAQADRVAGYYEWLGIKDETSFQRLIGFDAKRRRAKVELREAVSDSGVTKEPRAYVRYDADEGGAYRYTLDFRKAAGALDPLEVRGRTIEEVYRDPKNVKDVASEQFGDLPNGFIASGLFNNKGERQDSAPDFIASDKRSKSNDSRVHVNVSCLRCHDNAGTQTLVMWYRNLYQAPLALQDADYRQFRELKQQYLRKLEPAQERDRQRFTEAVKEATGRPVKEYLRAYAAFWERYEDARVDAEWAAQELGVTPDVLKKALRRQLETTGRIHHKAGAFLRGQHIGVRQYEDIHGELQTYLRGVQ